MSRTLFDRIWDAHVVADLGGGWVLLHVDRHLLHDLSGPMACKRSPSVGSLSVALICASPLPTTR
jgi:3-isopropylmalate/(R)-2-methylmalate dehydratase large subunit